MDIKVIDNNKSIQVVINDVKFNCDAIGKPYIMFWVDEDIADKLAFHLRAVVEDRQRVKEKQNKAGQE